MCTNLKFSSFNQNLTFLLSPAHLFKLSNQKWFALHFLHELNQSYISYHKSSNDTKDNIFCLCNWPMRMSLSFNSVSWLAVTSQCFSIIEKTTRSQRNWPIRNHSNITNIKSGLSLHQQVGKSTNQHSDEPVAPAWSLEPASISTLHIGHFLFMPSHWSTQTMWNKCIHGKRLKYNNIKIK